MPTVVTTAGTIEVWRGTTRVKTSKLSPALLAEIAALVESSADRAATFTVRLPVAPKFKYTKPLVGTINGAGVMPK